MSTTTDVLKDIIEQMEQLEHQALAALREGGAPDVKHELGEAAEEGVKGAPVSGPDVEAEGEGSDEEGGEVGEMPGADDMGAPADLEALKAKAAPPGAAATEAAESVEDEDGKKAKEIASRMFKKRGQ